MNYNEEVAVLRGLARKYLANSQESHNDERRTLHRAVNDLKMVRPIVLIDEIPWNELNVDNVLTPLCSDPDFKRIEMVMRKSIYQFENFRADMIVQPYLPIRKIVHSTGIGVGTIDHTLKDNTKSNISSHEYVDQFADTSGLEKLHYDTITYDEEGTNAKFFKIANAVGDIIPVRKIGVSKVGMTTWDRIANFRGVTPLLIDLMDEPEFSHELVAKLTDIYMNRHDQYLKLGLFDTSPDAVHSTSALNSTLHPEVDNCDYKNLWGRGAAQIFASVSKDMQEEFDIEYMKKTVGKCGLVYYGCCEGLDKKIDIVEKIPNLRKISITPWADVNVAAETIGKKYVIASKPNPSSVAVGTLDKEVLKKEICTIMDACYKNSCNFELTLKDISTVGGRPSNLFEWEKTVMDIIHNY
ncbi:MAG: hypothetical protein R3Y35_03665 [Clostridia bacterium]